MNINLRARQEGKGFWGAVVELKKGFRCGASARSKKQAEHLAFTAVYNELHRGIQW